MKYHRYRSTSSKCVKKVCNEEVGSVQASCYRPPDKRNEKRRRLKKQNMPSICVCVPRVLLVPTLLFCDEGVLWFFHNLHYIPIYRPCFLRTT